MSLADIKIRVQEAIQKAGRKITDVNVIGVSKRQPDMRVKAVLDEGLRIFGENTVQETARKWPHFCQHYNNIELHFLGALQTNKLRQAFDLFDYIHALDRVKLANMIARLADEYGKCPRLFIQVNTGDEAQKSGIGLEELPNFIKECRTLDLPVIGLMCLPPQHEEPSLHFALLAKLAKRYGLRELSMGMSADFERAIVQGATYIRIGSAIFGARER